MQEDFHKVINNDWLIKKFSLYGLLKNLKFFEPYLLIYLVAKDITLLEIGLLVSIREIIINVFEIPSGIIADRFGRKKELCACFIFYILSFVCFFIFDEFAGFIIAMIFFGLGEAFRSGSHKAMIYTYLEQKGWEDAKTYVYGKTRAASLLGSAISSFLGIAIILFVPNPGYIFLASTIPYAVDFLLVLSYPKSLDKGEHKEKIPLAQQFAELKKSLLHNKNLQKALIANGIFESTLSSIKDYIQPILSTLIIASSVIIFENLTAEDNLSVMLGIVYGILNIFSSFASKNAFKLKNAMGVKKSNNVLYVIFAISLVALGFSIQQTVLVCVFFVVINLLQNFRKPIFIDLLDNFMEKSQRATILSISAQLKSLFLIVLAPLAGFLADTFGMQPLMLAFAIIIILPYPFTRN